MRITLLEGSRARTFLQLRQPVSGEVGIVIRDVQLMPNGLSLLFTYGFAPYPPVSSERLWDTISEYWKNNGE